MGYLATLRTIQSQIYKELSLVSEVTESMVISYLTTLAQRTRDFASDGYIRDAMAQLTATEAPPAGEAMPLTDSTLSAHLERNKRPIIRDALETFVVTLDGRVVASSLSSNVGAELKGLNIIEAGRSDLTVSGIIFPDSTEASPAGAAPSFDIAVPIMHREREELVGVLINRIEAGGISRSITEGLARTKSTHVSLRAYLINRNGLVIADSSRDATARLPRELPTPSSYRSTSAKVQRYQGLAGNQVLGVATRLKEQDWLLVVEVATDEAFSPLADLRRTLVTVGVGLLVLTLVLLYFPIRFMSVPLVRLTEAARKIEGGDLDVRVEVQSQDEIGQLAQSFNRMSAQLLKRTEELKQSYKDLEVRERQIRNEKDLLNTVITSLNDGMVFIDRDLQIVFSNNATILARQAGDHLGASILDCVPKAIPESVLEQILPAQQGLAVKPQSDLRVNGHIFENVYIRVVSSANEHLGLVWVSRDVTEQKQIEQQLMHSEKLAGIGQLSAGVAHELNTPLGSIVFCAEDLLDFLDQTDLSDGAQPEQIREFAHIIQEQAFRCKHITESLLNFARKGEVTIEDVDINTILDELISLMGSLGGKRDISILQSFTERQLWITTDSSLLRQILLNLFSNAVDAIKGRGTIKVSTNQLSDDKVEIVVADDGVGIPEEHLSKVFEPFFTTKPEGQGTGLGLSLCYGAVKELGGDIHLESELDAWTVVTVLLPRRYPGRDSSMGEDAPVEH